ncbi:FG-GAP-like repeat-containing protein [Streptomyces sp. NPDC012825]|uniref:FG-GAP-like repeat-containing protein n=1 Tax=Streptomyces sp. NPDC012825 TaxID=3364851 RepID=UPI0036AC76EE
MKLTKLLAGALIGGMALLGLPAATATATATAADTPWSAAPPDLTVVSWNICGEAGAARGSEGYCPYRRLVTGPAGEVIDQNVLKAQEIARLIKERNADAVVLQEVCGTPEGLPGNLGPGTHQAELEKELAKTGETWSFSFAPARRGDDTDTKENSDADLWGSACRGEAFGGGTKGRLGNLIAVKGTTAAAGSKNSVPVTTPLKDQLVLPVQCVALTGKPVGVCNTHIIASNGLDDPRVEGQVANVKAFVENFRNQHGLRFTVLGGDFNRPTEQVHVRSSVDATKERDEQLLKPLTDVYENCVDGTTHHGWSVKGGYHTWHEYDHLFVTRRTEGSAFSSCDIDESRMDTSKNVANEPVNGWSDHAPVIARLGGDRAPGDLSGDGRPDLLAVDSAGRLHLYHGNGKGGVAPYTANGATTNSEVIGNSGWSGASIGHRGDFTRDGLEDVVARVGTQLRIYPSRFVGTRLAPATVVADGLPTDAQVVTAGDVNGDGDADVVVSAVGKLWLYENDSAAAVSPAVWPRVEIGNGGWSPMTIAAPGDLDKDGHPDLLVRDTRDGLLYRYDGSTTFGTRTQIGSGFTTTGRPLIAGAADADLDGNADMWTTNGDGTLGFYGNPAGRMTAVVGNSGWDTITAIG